MELSESLKNDNDRFHVEGCDSRNTMTSTKIGEMAIAAACYAAPYSIKADICITVPCSCREATCNIWRVRYREKWLARPVLLEWGIGQARKARTNSATRNRRSTS